MGLLRAATSTGAFRDQWLEYFSCDSMSNEELVKRATRITKGNNKGNPDIISNGSVISVNEGQVAIIVSNGKIAEFCAETGAFKWENSIEPSLFCGGFFKGLIDTFKKLGERFTFSGDTPNTQRVYYVNVKEIIGNKFGTSTPMAYDDPYYKTALYIRYFGQYSFKITDPLMFFASISGNVSDVYKRTTLEGMITDEFMTALDTSLSLCSNSGCKFSQLPQKQREIAKFMSDTLDDEWNERRGMKIVSVAISKVTPDDKSRERIETFDTNVMHSDPNAMTGGLAYAQMQAMQKAAENEGGAMMGFAGLGMAAGAMGGAQMGSTLINAAQKQKEAESKEAESKEVKPSADEWKCACGTVVSGRFCPECGAKKPEEKKASSWKCACGTECNGKFCPECGAKKPSDKFACECGYEADKPFKFCPECGKKQ